MRGLSLKPTIDSLVVGGHIGMAQIWGYIGVKASKGAKSIYLRVIDHGGKSGYY